MYRINLNEIPAEGRAYQLTRASGEITAELKDLIGRRDFKIEFFLRPMGNIYELTGTLSTALDEVCSRCGWDVTLPVERRFQEYLLSEGDQPRDAQSVHGNQSLDLESEGISVSFYRGEAFYVGEYFHELIAVNEPAYPSCGLEDCEHLQDVKAILHSLESETPIAQPASHKPFASLLKDLKVEKT